MIFKTFIDNFIIVNLGQIMSKFPKLLDETELIHRYLECIKNRQNMIYNSTATKLQNFLQMQFLTKFWQESQEELLYS